MGKAEVLAKKNNSYVVKTGIIWSVKKKGREAHFKVLVLSVCGLMPLIYPDFFASFRYSVHIV